MQSGTACSKVGETTDLEIQSILSDLVFLVLISGYTSSISRC